MATHILMSFAMADHGATFGHWLRDKLMKHYHLYDVDAVYLDSVVARSGDAREHGLDFAGQAAAAAGVARISPDRRAHMLSASGAHPIGAMRADWDTLYKNAMREAACMIFVNTNKFGQSEWCKQELAQFHKENTRRQLLRRPVLRGVFLEFAGSADLHVVLQGHIKLLNVEKFHDNFARFAGQPSWPERQAIAWDHGDFVLSPNDFAALTVAIGNIVH